MFIIRNTSEYNRATAFFYHKQRLLFGFSKCGGIFRGDYKPPPGTTAMIELANRRECFFDFLIDTKCTSATLELHHPQFRETVLHHDAPWEGDGCDYHNLFFDKHYHGFDNAYPDGVYRMYYLGWGMISEPKNAQTTAQLHSSHTLVK